MTQEETCHSYRWNMLVGVWLIYFCFGLTVTSMAPLVNVIVEDLGLSLSAMGSVLGAWPLVYIASALPCSALLDRVGLRRGLLIAAIVISLSGALRAVASNYVELFLAVAVFGVGGPLVSVGGPKLVSLWFDSKERGLAMGIYITGPALGGIFAMSATNGLVMPILGGDWRKVMLVYATFTFCVGLLWLLIAGHGASRAVENKERSRTREGTLQVFKRLVGLPVVKLVLLMSIGIFFFNHGLNNWLPEILRAGGMDPVKAGYWAAIPTAVGIAGSLLIPRFAVGPRRFSILLALFGCAAVATLLIHSHHPLPLTTGLVLQGIARSSMMPIAILVLIEAREVGSRYAAAAGGLFFTAAEIGGVLGPLTIGVVTDVTNDFSASLYLLTAVCAGLMTLGVVLGRSTRTAR